MNKKDFYNSLGDEVKAKIKACRSEAEMLKVLEDAKVELDPELLNGVSGGSSHHCGVDCDDDYCESFCFCD